MMSLKRQYIADFQSGLSLVELMVALVVGLILLAGVITIFVSSRGSYDTNTAISQVQENGRFALNFLRTDVRMAGNMGCTRITNTDSIINTTNPPPVMFDFTKPVYGYEANGTGPGSTYTLLPNPVPDTNSGDWTPSLDNSLVGLVMQGSDVLILHGTLGTPVTVTYINNSAANFQVATLSGVQTGELGIITDCVKATAFQVTNTNVPQSTIVHSQSGAVSPGDSQNTFNETYQAGAQFLQLQTVAFYIGKGADNSPALFEADLEPNSSGNLNNWTTQELVSGVVNMQVLYGVDTTGTQVPSLYETAAQVDAANQWNSVVSVQVAVLVRSNPGAITGSNTAQTFNLLGTAVTAPLDTRLRRVFAATIGLRNFLP